MTSSLSQGDSKPRKRNRSFSMMSVMDRYLIQELIAPFLFGLGAFTSVGVAIGTVFDLVRKISEVGLPVAIAIKVFFLQLPYFISFAIPTALLLGSIIAYSRLSSDSELIALRSAGVSIYRLILPTLIFSLILTGITFTFNELVVPAAKREATLTLDRALKQDAPLQEAMNIFYPEYRRKELADGKKVRVLTRLFYAEFFDGKAMKGLTILDRSQPQFKQIVISEAAEWNAEENTWDFFNGTIYVVDQSGSFKNIVKFDRQQLKLPRAPLDLASIGTNYEEMNIAESLEYLKIIEVSGDRKQIRKLQIRIQQRFAIPFACIAFGLMGAALGTRPQRNAGRATGFGISVLIIFSYYLLMSVGDAFGLSGVLPPVVSAWLPTFSALGIGIILLLRVTR
nr:LptF/LptG family permease [Roseofilum casamattae]